MNAGKIITNLVRRYAHGPRRQSKRRPNPGIQRTLDILEDDPVNNFDSVENLNLEDVEPDISHVHESYSSYQKELARSKEKLKLRIVTRKYFAEMDPSLLTYVEKEQIRNLHNSDPVEYTPEKLSESFPSLPHTIRKVIKARWTPRSADRVIKHDEIVIENWKKFKRGELPLEPRLREHLQKFKGRIIRLPNREEVEKKLIPPPITFPEPKSQLYSGLVRTYLEQKTELQVDNNETRLSLPEKFAESCKDGVSVERLNPDDLMDGLKESREEPTPQYSFENRLAIQKEKKARASKSEKDLVTLDEFFENTVKKIGPTPSLEDRVLMDTYKQNKESELTRQKNTGFDDRLNPLKLDTGSKSVAKSQRPESLQVSDESKESGLETYVKVWEKKASQDELYPEFIKIPRDKYKRGKIYQLRDCYYDNDGEFLYRVPGLKE